MNELIKKMQEKGLVSIMPLRFRGKSNSVWNLIAIMADTAKYNTTEPVIFERRICFNQAEEWAYYEASKDCGGIGRN